MGGGCFESLKRHLGILGARRILLVRGVNSFEKSGASRTVEPLRKTFVINDWSGFSENPSLDELIDGLRVARAFSPDTIVGIGGGTAMDLAKMISALVDTPAHRVEAMILAGGVLDQRRTKLLLVPTTSGSGSESTHFAVVYIKDQKYSVAGSALRADLALVDYRLTLSGSPYQRACSGLDALTQSIESIWARDSTRKSRKIARRALRDISTSLLPFAKGDTSKMAFLMSKGSNEAGKAIDISKTTAPHALSYKITQRYGIPHGNAVGLTIGKIFDHHANYKDLARSTPRSTRRRLQKNLKFIRKTLRMGGAQSGTEFFENLLASLHVVPTLRAAGAVSESEILEIVSSVNLERLANNPIRLTEDDLLAILREGPG